MNSVPIILLIVGGILCLMFGACEHHESVMSLNDVWPYSWIEEDVQTIPSDRSGTPFFVSGFFAPGDSGRSMKNPFAYVDIYTVSDYPKRVTFHVSVPPGGGEVRIIHSDSDTLADVVVGEGFQEIPVVLRPRHLQRGRVRLKVAWTPLIGDYSSSRLTIREIQIVSNRPDVSLASVNYDSVDQTLSLDSGCAVRLYLIGGERMVISGRVSGLQGNAGIRLGRNGREPEDLLNVVLDDPHDNFSVNVPSSESGDMVEITFYARRSNSPIMFSSLKFSGFRGPDMDIGHEVRPVYSVERSDRPFNILLYVIDTVRRDRLTLYGYDKLTTPGFSRGKSEWIVWDNCRSMSSWTKAATASILTGVDPVVHGAIDDDDVVDPACEFIWEPYHDAGYTVAFLSTNGHIAERWGFVRKVNYYRQFRELATRREVHYPADSLHMAFLEWLDTRPQGEQPFFAYMHATDPHIPYTPDPEFIERLYPQDIPQVNEINISTLARMICPGITHEWETTQASALYDAEIAEWDAAFSTLLDDLELRNLLDRTIIIVTSDHGEEFHEHGGFSHGMTLYREQLNIPLLMRVPGIRGGKISTLMDHRDLIDLVHWVTEGRDPYRWEPEPRTWGISHLSLRGREIARLENRDFACIWNISLQGLCDVPSPEFELFMNYSREDENIASEYGVRCRFMRMILNNWLSRLSEEGASVSNLDPEMVERLRFLGYMTDE